MRFFPPYATTNGSRASIQLSHLRREVLILIEACRPELLAVERRTQTKNAALTVLRQQPVNCSIEDLADSVLEAADRNWANAIIARSTAGPHGCR